MQTDPIGDGINMYAYVGGDPVNFRDPLGLDGDSIDDIVATGRRNRREIVNAVELRPVAFDADWGFAAAVDGLGAFSIAPLGVDQDAGNEDIVVTARPRQRPCIAGPRITFSWTLGGTAFLWDRGASGNIEVGLSIPTSGNWRGMQGFGGVTAGGLAPEKWRADIDLNVHSACHCVQAAAEYMIVQGSSSIVTISPRSGVNGTTGAGAYAAAKAGLQMFTRVATVEWGLRGIRVNCVAAR